MSDDNFPYNMPGREALVRLINDTYPGMNMGVSTTEFDPPFFSPTEDTPGRTFIEAHELHKHFWFVYRRLDLAIALPDNPVIFIDGTITPKSIVEEINRTMGMHFDESDVVMVDIPLVPLGESTTYRMKAKTGSYVWYGEILIEAHSGDITPFTRLMEDGEIRLLEDGNPRLLETAV